MSDQNLIVAGLAPVLAARGLQRPVRDNEV
jgi:hypothetical protein